jgi:hypothetical protein
MIRACNVALHIGHLPEGLCRQTLGDKEVILWQLHEIDSEK